MRRKEKTYIVGHKNPDTDSICSAIAYAELKRRTEEGEFLACRAGEITEETQFVLRHFGVEAPELFCDASTEVKEIEIHEIVGIHRETSVKQAWKFMNRHNVVTLPILGINGTLEGLITVSDIAQSYMDIHDSDILSQANTSFASIAETLDAKILVGDEKRLFTEGRVVVGAFPSELMGNYIHEKDLIIMGNRPDDLICAMEHRVSGVVVGLGARVSDLIIQLAKQQDCVIISSPHDTYTNARLINQSLPVRHLMTAESIVKFHLNDKVRDIREVMKTLRHRDFPILDADEKYVGTISRRNLIGCKGKKVILVDHNERAQAVDHVEEAEILEVIDHHRLGSLETIEPILFRNEPVGCTATIICSLYRQHGVEIPQKVAGLLCSAILSDTLIFHSPTCTEQDRLAALELAKIAGIGDIDAYAKQMFRAGSDLGKKTTQEILFQDFKRFHYGDIKMGVGQISLLDEEELAEIRSQMQLYFRSHFAELKLGMAFFLLTNIQEQSSEVVFCGEGSRELLEQAFGQKIEGDACYLPDVVSRKKQFIPALMRTNQGEDPSD